MGHNGRVLMGNRKVQRITGGVIIGVVVISLALTLVAASAAPLASSSSGMGVSDAASPTPTPSSTPDAESLGSSGDPKPVTKTPQGQATQVSDREHIGGLIAFLGFMLGGVLLLVRGRRRDRHQARREPILS